MAPLRLYNTLTGEKEPFEPIVDGRVLMYVCGPTVYDYGHIGHARAAVAFDVAARHLRAAGYDLVYVRNITDVDDKIIARAKESGSDYFRVADKFARAAKEDMAALNVLEPDAEPRVSDHLGEIIDFVSLLMEKGHAYEAGGDVFYSIETFPGYGKLSGRKPGDMMAGCRVAVDERKRHPFDFSLWKRTPDDEPSWESPWGRGRPGWHIECSTLVKVHLGETIDIHGGGSDLIFPHHENEIVQSEALSGKPLAGCWLHNELVNIRGEKMSKSSGNSVVLRDLFELYHPEAVRLLLLRSHYRRPMDFSDARLKEAVASLDRLYTFKARAERRFGPPAGEEPDPGFYRAEFSAAMDDDLNAARGLAILFKGVRHANRLLNQPEESLSSKDRERLRVQCADLLRIGREILGILGESPGEYIEKRRSLDTGRARHDPHVIEKLIEERAAARKDRDWTKADRIKQRLEGMGVALKDGPEGTGWKYLG
jgi:cysteinyl-tRNA synthetase